MREWNTQFSDTDEWDLAIGFWAAETEQFDDFCFKKARNIVLTGGMEKPPNLSQFKKICLDNENKPLSPLYVPKARREPEPHNPEAKAGFNALREKLNEECAKSVKKPKYIETRTEEEIERDFQANKVKMYEKLKSMGIDLPPRTGA